MMEAVIVNMEASGLDDARKMVHTESNPMGRLASPDEVASVALFLACAVLRSARNDKTGKALVTTYKDGGRR
jgi:NAD(P)-dependent dehydrogenase (short-subunit alcohol dehydrogenase family)